MDADDTDLMIEGESSAPKTKPRLKTKSNVLVREKLGDDEISFSLPKSALQDVEDSYLILGFDTEYQPPDHITNEGVKAGLAKYEVLSYQFYAINHLGEEWKGLVVPNFGKRIGLADFILYALAKGAAAGKALPSTIVLVGHFTKADLPAFEDRGQIFYQLNNIRNSLITLGHAVPIGVEFDDETEQTIRVHVRDTMQLAPAGKQSLGDLGKLIGLEKLRLADNRLDEQVLKERMKIVRADAWEIFEEYALRDAEVCAKYYQRVAAQYEEVTGKAGIPTSLSSIALKLLLNDWNERGVDSYEAVGRELVQEDIYNDKREQYVTVKRYPLIEEIALFEQLATECYHGGNNQQMWFGPSFMDAWIDHDLAGAYPTGMAMIGSPQWREARYSKTLSDFVTTQLGFALIKFKFPSDTRYPSLPVRSQNGIIFPLEGQSYCCTPEIQLALNLGCQIEVRHGVVIPVNESVKPFFPFIKDSIAKRRAAKTDIENGFWKELTNSCYGKTAQGLRDKRTFNLKDEKSEKAKRSKITNPFFAAYITSLVRAVVAEIMNSLPSAAMVFSVTTDGFITNASDAEVTAASQGALCKAFAATRLELTGSDNISEKKHSMRQILGWRTRGQATIQKDGEKFVLARAGIKPPMSCEDDTEKNDYILRTFFERTPETIIEFKVPTSFREMIMYDADMVMKALPRRTSMEYDYKRKPFSVRDTSVQFECAITGEMKGYSHVAFSTVPWKNVEEFNAARKFRDDFWRKAPRCIKTAEDYRAMAQLHDALKALGKNARYLSVENGALKRLKRDLCCAFKQGKAGFEHYRSISASNFAALLNSAGFTHLGMEVKRTDVEYGARATFLGNTTPSTPDALALLENIKKYFPLLEQDAILAAPVLDGTQLLPALNRPCQFMDRPQ